MVFRGTSSIFLSLNSALGMLVIRPLITHLYLIIAVIAFSYGIATLYANIIIYTVSVFNVENGYMWVFYIGAQVKLLDSYYTHTTGVISYAIFFAKRLVLTLSSYYQHSIRSYVASGCNTTSEYTALIVCPLLTSRYLELDLFILT